MICKELGLFSLGHISVDGSKIKANASKKTTRRIRKSYRVKMKLRKYLIRHRRLTSKKMKNMVKKKMVMLCERTQDKK